MPNPCFHALNGGAPALAGSDAGATAAGWGGAFRDAFESVKRASQTTVTPIFRRVWPLVLCLCRCIRLPLHTHPGGRIPFAEHLHCVHGLCASFRAVYICMHSLVRAKAFALTCIYIYTYTSKCKGFARTSNHLCNALQRLCKCYER